MLKTMTVLLMIALSLPTACEPLFKDAESIPADAIVLFDGRDLSNWSLAHTDQPATWKVENSYMQVASGSIATKQRFTDCQLHVEFWLPLMPNAQGQARANSGVYTPGAGF